MSKIDEEVGERNQYQKSAGKRQLVFFQTMSSGNVWGSLYWKLLMGRKGAGFGKLLPAKTLGRKQVK